MADPDDAHTKTVPVGAQPTTPSASASEEPAPSTPRVCEACGGPAGRSADDAVESRSVCPWCTGGFQNARQYRIWTRVRSRMRNMSGTYSFVEETAQDLFGRLNRIADDEELENRYATEAHGLHTRGTIYLDDWARNKTDRNERDRAVDALNNWRREVLDFLERVAKDEPDDEGG